MRVIDHDQGVPCARRLKEVTGLPAVERQRFLDQDRQSGGDRGMSHLGMNVGRGRDDHAIQIGSLDEFPPIGAEPAIRIDQSSVLRVACGEARQPRAVDLGDGADVIAAPAAGAEQSEAEERRSSLAGVQGTDQDSPV